MKKVLLSNKFMSKYVGEDVITAKIRVKKYRNLLIPFVVAGSLNHPLGVYLLVEAKKLKINSVDYVAVVQAPIKIMADYREIDWKTAIKYYSGFLIMLSMKKKPSGKKGDRK